jgi:hypothetical protein
MFDPVQLSNNCLNLIDITTSKSVSKCQIYSSDHNNQAYAYLIWISQSLGQG